MSAPSGKGGVVEEFKLLSVDEINAYLARLDRREAEGVLREGLDLACLDLAANYRPETAEQLWDHFLSWSIRHHRQSVAIRQARQGEE